MSSIDRARLAAARLWAVNRFPYLAAAIFASPVVVVEGLNGMAVDESWRLYVDPFIVNEWPVPTIGSLMVHHAGHLLREHAARAEALGITKEQQKEWALAADAEINDDFEGAGLELPGEPVLPEHLGCEDGHFAEEYFRALSDPPSPQGAPNCGSGADGVGRAHDLPAEGGISKMGRHLLRCQVASDLLRQCKGLEPGMIPAGLLRWAQDLLEPRIDWRKALAAEIRQGVNSIAGAVDYSYARPSRRQTVVADVVMPALRKPVPTIAVVCDTSGSMNENQLGQALAEVEGLLKSVGVSRHGIRILSCDADVHAVKRVTSVRAVELFGGGGTDMGRGIETAAALRPKPGVVVVLTDGYTPWPSAPPPGVKVVVGLLAPRAATYPPPAWARTVEIDEVA